MGRVDILGQLAVPSLMFQSARPIWGASVKARIVPKRWEKFQSARPIWGASFNFAHFAVVTVVSIRTPHMGRVNSSTAKTQRSHVSIRTPHMGRVDLIVIRHDVITSFNPHAPYGARLLRFPLVHS